MEIKIDFAEQFFYYQTYDNIIKTYYQLNEAEEDAFWMFLDDLLEKVDLEGKNKPSNIIDFYDPVSKDIVIQEIKSTKGDFFTFNNVWHYHFENALSSYNPKKYHNKPTKAILLQNLLGRTNSYLIHYYRIQSDNEIIIRIIGVSEHSCWEELYKTIKNED